MITKVKITDKTKTSVPYVADLMCFDTKNEFHFKPGINIIVGPNGSGKSTLLKIIERYLLIKDDKQEIRNLNELCINHYNLKSGPLIPNGVEVFSDYKTTSFKFVHMSDLSKNGKQNWLDSIQNFRAACASMNSSTGETVNISLDRLFERMFNGKTDLKFPINDIKEQIKKGNGIWSKEAKVYQEYIDKYSIPFNKNDAEFTIFLDEPDRNLDILHINEIYSILSERKKHAQIIAVIHNPLLIYKLSKHKDINWIEFEDGYINKIKKCIDDIVK